MYTKKRLKKVTSEVNLAPLMDVLTCTVGVMLFVVIFVVLQAQGKTIPLFAPIQKGEPPKNSERNLLICKNGRIKFLDIAKAQKNLLSQGQQNYENVPEIVELANKKNVSDPAFKFTYGYEDTYSPSDGVARYYTIVVNEIDSAAGEGIDDLKSSKSAIGKLIANLDPRRNWIAFALADEKSIEVFRQARQIADKKGVPNGWDPVKLNFPITIPLIGSEGSPIIDFGIQH